MAQQGAWYNLFACWASCERSPVCMIYFTFMRIRFPASDEQKKQRYVLGSVTFDASDFYGKVYINRGLKNEINCLTSIQ